MLFGKNLHEWHRRLQSACQCLRQPSQQLYLQTSLHGEPKHGGKQNVMRGKEISTIELCYWEGDNIYMLIFWCWTCESRALWSFHVQNNPYMSPHSAWVFLWVKNTTFCASALPDLPCMDNHSVSSDKQMYHGFCVWRKWPVHCLWLHWIMREKARHEQNICFTLNTSFSSTWLLFHEISQIPGFQVDLHYATVSTCYLQMWELIY